MYSVGMYCPECNKETPDEAQFCIECGARVNKECPRCALVIRLRARMCLHCKYELTEADVALVEKKEVERLDKLNQEETLIQEAKREKEAKDRFTRFHPPALIAGWGRKVHKCKRCGALHPRWYEIHGLGPYDCRMCRGNSGPQGFVTIPNPWNVNEFSKRERRNAKRKGALVSPRTPSGGTEPDGLTNGLKSRAAPVSGSEPEPPPEPERQTPAVAKVSPSKPKRTSAGKIGNRTGLALAILVAMVRYLQHVGNYGWSASTAYPQFIGDMFVSTVVGYVAGWIIGIIAAGLWRAMKSD